MKRSINYNALTTALVLFVLIFLISIVTNDSEQISPPPESNQSASGTTVEGDPNSINLQGTGGSLQESSASNDSGSLNGGNSTLLDSNNAGASLQPSQHISDPNNTSVQNP